MTYLLIPAIVIALDLIVRLIAGARNSRVPPPGPHRTGTAPIGYLRVLANTVALLALAAAAITAPQSKLTGDRLIWHVTAAPAFALAAVAMVIFWAHRNRFSGTDGSRLVSPSTWAVPLRKFFFWVAVVLAIPTILAILGAMFPLFGTDDQQDLIEIHRYCAQLTAAAALLFTYFALVSWRERSAD